MMTIAISGDAAIAARLAGFPSRLQQRLSSLMATLGVELSDRLAREGISAPDIAVDSDATSATLALGGLAHGRTVRAHLGKAKRRFAKPARRSAARAPARSFLGAAFAGFSSDAAAAVEAAVLDELRP